MRFDSLQFVWFCLLAVFLLRTAGVGWYRNALVAVLNFYFLYSFSFSPVALVPIVIFVAMGYVAILVAKRTGTSSGIGIVLAVLIAVFAWLKHYSVVVFLPSLDFPYATIGMSYMLFRMIHLIVDVAQGAMRTPSPLAYFNYTFFFLNLVSGPIQRFQDFAAQSIQTRVKDSPEEMRLALVESHYRVLYYHCGVLLYFL